MASPTRHKTVIKAGQPWWYIPLGEMWEYRGLLWNLVKRDFVTVYKQTILGPAWFVLQPLMMTIVFTIVFGRIARMPTDGLPKFLFFMCGSVMWNYTKSCLDGVSDSLKKNASIFGKVYFPRLIPPLAIVIHSLGRLFLNLFMFVGFLVYFKCFTNAEVRPNWAIGLMPLLIAYCAVLGLGVGLWFSALTAKYRDLKMALPFFSQLWMYATPVVYPASEIPARFKWVLSVNPMSSVTELSRVAFLGRGTVDLAVVVSNMSVTLLVLVTGVFFFNKVQRTYIDTV